MVLNVHRNHKAYSGRRDLRGGGGLLIYLSVQSTREHQNDSCIKVASDESHFNVS